MGAGLCLLRAAVRRDERGAWLLLGLGVSAWVLGELYFTAVLWSHMSPPVPSPADAGYLSLLPLVFAGLIALARSLIRGLPRTLWVDGVTAGLPVGAVSAALVFKPVLAALGGRARRSPPTSAIRSPTSCSLGSSAHCWRSAVGGRRVDRRLGVLALGIACFWTSDTVYLVNAAQGTCQSGGPYDPGWWAIAVCFAAAAWMEPRGPATRCAWEG